MDHLKTFVDLLAGTEGRDMSLRLVQYATLGKASAGPGPIKNVYEQFRRTRKILRFLRTIECSTVIRAKVTALQTESKIHLAHSVVTILENVCRLMFYLSDHRVVLSELGVISAEQKLTHYPRSMKSYLFEKIFGMLRGLLNAVLIIGEAKFDNKDLDYEEQGIYLKRTAIDFVKCMLDCVVALHYLNGKPGARVAGAVGVITSVIAILQLLKKI